MEDGRVGMGGRMTRIYTAAIENVTPACNNSTPSGLNPITKRDWACWNMAFNC